VMRCAEARPGTKHMNSVKTASRFIGVILAGTNREPCPTALELVPSLLAWLDHEPRVPKALWA
jgi:hypothetical protein